MGGGGGGRGMVLGGGLIVGWEGSLVVFSHDAGVGRVEMNTDT